MRFSRVSSLLSAVALAAVGVCAEAQGATLHLLPAVEDVIPKNIQWDEAVSIIAYALGVSHLSPALQFADHHAEVLNDAAVQKVVGSLLEPARPNLLIVARGLTADGVPVPAKYSIGTSSETAGSLISDLAYDFSELSADKYDSGLSTLYVTSQTGDKPLSNCAMVKLQDGGAAVSASKTSENVRATLNEISATAYSDVKAHFMEKFGKKVEIFDESEPIEKFFMVEMEFISSLFEAMRIQSLHPESKTQASFQSIVLNLAKLDALAAKEGTESKKYLAAVSIMREVLEEATQTFTKLHTKSSIEILSVPPATLSASTVGTYPRPVLRRSVDPRATTTCAKDKETCQKAFNSCSGHGVCEATRVGSQVCFACRCNGTQWTDDDGKVVEGYGPVKWTGNSCQYQDISVSFQLVFWLTLVLLVVLGLAVSLLYNIGSSNGSGPGKRSKSD